MVLGVEFTSKFGFLQLTLIVVALDRRVLIFTSYMLSC